MRVANKNCLGDNVTLVQQHCIDVSEQAGLTTTACHHQQSKSQRQWRQQSEQTKYQLL
jgi:hypothetical protein